MSEEDYENLQAGVMNDEEVTETTAVAPVEDVGAPEELGPDLIVEPDEPEGEKAEPEQPKSDATQQAWDRERQERDQRNAAERKATEAQLETLQAKMEAADERIKQLRAQQKTAKTASGEEPPELTPDSEIEEIATVLNQQRRAAKEAKEEVAAIRKELADKDKAETARLADEAKKAAKASLKAQIAMFEGEYGKKYSGEAQKRAHAYFAEKGYDEDNPPPDEALGLAFEKFFREVRDSDPNRKPSEPQKPSPPLDTGTGGSRAEEPQRPMTDAQYKASARRKGIDID